APGTNYFGNMERHPEYEPVPGVLVFRVDGAMLYFNTEYIRDRFYEHLAKWESAPRLVVWSLSTTPASDLAGIDLLRDLHEELAHGGTELRLAEARGPPRNVLRTAGLKKQFGPISDYTAIAATIRQWESSASAPTPPVR